MIGNGADKCGAIANRLALSCNASFTRRYCKNKNVHNYVKLTSKIILLYETSNYSWTLSFSLNDRNRSYNPIYLHSEIQTNNDLTCSLSNCIIAFCRYRTPPCINLVLRLLVPEEKSSLSTNAVLRPKKKNKS